MPHDQDQARSLLDQSGWLDTDGDGIRQRGDVMFKFTALVGNPQLATTAVYVQSQFREIGVRMEIQMLQGGFHGRLRAGDFQAAFGRFEPFQPGDIQWLNGKVAIQYENPRVRALIDAAQETMDPAVEDSLYQILMPFIAAEQPVTILFPEVTTYVAKRSVRGLHSPYRANPFLFAEFLRLEEQ
jgi:peptide/nickel transport system substrate-binding protein